jgi:hypothetical protein
MREIFEATSISTPAEELPQHFIEALAELLLDLAEQGAPSEQCCSCGSIQTTCGKADNVERNCCMEMQQLLGAIPVSSEHALADSWYKATRAVTDGTGKLIPWQPKETN